MRLKEFQSTPQEVLVRTLVTEDSAEREAAIQRALNLAPDELTEVLKSFPESNHSLRREVGQWAGLILLNMMMLVYFLIAIRNSWGGSAFGLGVGLIVSILCSYPVINRGRVATKKTQLKVDLGRKSTCLILSKTSKPEHIGVLLDLICKYQEQSKQAGAMPDASTSLPAWIRFPLFDAMRRLIPALSARQCHAFSPEQLKALLQSVEVFIDCNEPLTSDILMVLAEAGYTKAKPLFKKVSKSNGHSQELRESASLALERLEKRLAEIKEVGVLLRPSSFEPVESNLLIPARSAQEDDAPQTLLRPG